MKQMSKGKDVIKRTFDHQTNVSEDKCIWEDFWPSKNVTEEKIIEKTVDYQTNVSIKKVN